MCVYTVHESDEHEFHPVARWRAQDRHLAAMKEVHVNQSTAYIVSTPSANHSQYHARDTGSESCWGWFGSGAETIAYSV